VNELVLASTKRTGGNDPTEDRRVVRVRFNVERISPVQVIAQWLRPLNWEGVRLCDVYRALY
jgi:hypothetical protein